MGGRTMSAKMRNRLSLLVIGIAAVTIGFVVGLNHSTFNIAEGAGERLQEESMQSAYADIPKSDVYYPNTEKLGPNEMRVIALGTGLPTPLTAKQKSAAWLVELGNGDKFIFDIGTGSVENLFALQIDFQELDKVFASHLHTDHVGDFDALWVGGWLSGRYTPLHIYGPSSTKPELGIKAFAENLTKTYAWDNVTRSGTLPVAGGRIIAHEFDYRQVNGVVYEENGVRITSFPAIHSYDGAVSYRLDWNGLSFVFGGDSAPNKWFIEFASGVDIAIHECIYTPEGMNTFYGWNNMRQATYVAAYIHTPPAAFGKLMSAVRPRLAVAYHAVLLPELLQDSIETIRTTYDGPLSVASDLYVYNVTKDEITIREAAVADLLYPPRPSPEYATAERSEEIKMTDFPMSGWWEEYVPPPLPEG
jgi:ribonuclease Z